MFLQQQKRKKKVMSLPCSLHHAHGMFVRLLLFSIYVKWPSPLCFVTDAMKTDGKKDHCK